MYVSGGFNVYPAEVEAVLRLHPAVGQVAVIGVPDRRMGEVGLALVVPAAGERARWARGDADRVGPGAAGQLQGAPRGRGRSTRCRSTPAARCSSASSGSSSPGRRRRGWASTAGPSPTVRSRVQDRQAGTERRSREREGAMRGIVYTGDDAEVTDELRSATPGPPRSGWPSGPPACATATCRCINGTIPWKAPSVLGHEGAGVVEAVGSEVRSVKVGDHVVIATLASCGTCRACSTGHPTWCVKTLGQRVAALHLQGRAGLQLRRHLGLRRIDHRQGGPGGQDLQGRADDLGLPHRLRRAHRRGLGAQPGQGAGRGDRGRLRRRRRRAQRDPGPAARRCQPDHRRRHPGLPRRGWPGSSAPPTSSTPRRPTRWRPSARSSLPGPTGCPGALGWTGGVTWSFDCVGHPGRAAQRPRCPRLGWQRPGHRHPAPGHRGRRWT